MWIPAKLLDFLAFSKEDLIAIRTERDILKDKLTSANILSDWLRMRVNCLEMERVALLEKAYGVKLPAPEIARTPVLGQPHHPEEFSFEGIPFTDEGDKLAAKYGLS